MHLWIDILLGACGGALYRLLWSNSAAYNKGFIAGCDYWDKWRKANGYIEGTVFPGMKPLEKYTCKGEGCKAILSGALE